MNNDWAIAALWCVAILGAGATIVLAINYALERGWLR